jgi:hypothetical protein
VRHAGARRIVHAARSSATPATHVPHNPNFHGVSPKLAATSATAINTNPVHAKRRRAANNYTSGSSAGKRFAPAGQPLGTGTLNAGNDECSSRPCRREPWPPP